MRNRFYDRRPQPKSNIKHAVFDKQTYNKQGHKHTFMIRLFLLLLNISPGRLLWIYASNPNFIRFVSLIQQSILQHLSPLELQQRNILFGDGLGSLLPILTGSPM